MLVCRDTRGPSVAGTAVQPDPEQEYLLETTSKLAARPAALVSCGEARIDLERGGFKRAIVPH